MFSAMHMQARTTKDTKVHEGKSLCACLRVCSCSLWFKDLHHCCWRSGLVGITRGCEWQENHQSCEQNERADSRKIEWIAKNLWRLLGGLPDGSTQSRPEQSQKCLAGNQS